MSKYLVYVQAILCAIDTQEKINEKEGMKRITILLRALIHQHLAPPVSSVVAAFVVVVVDTEHRPVVEGEVKEEILGEELL